MKYRNFFTDKSIFVLMLIFIILSIVHIIYATLTYRGLVIDGAMYFPEILNKLSAQDYGFYIVYNRTRIFINIINQLPVNIAYWLGVQSKTILAAIFSLPLFLFPFLVTLYNIFLAKKTKRYDIALLGLILYNCLILPSIMYSVVEAFLAGPLLIVFLHYYLSDINYNKKDIFIIFLISIIIFEGSELTVFLLPFIIISKFYINQNQKSLKEKIIKFYIESTVILSSFYILFINLFVFSDIQSESITFFKEITQDRPNLFICLIKEPYLIEIITLVIFSILIFNRKKFNKKVIFVFSVFYSGILLYMFNNAMTYFYKFHYVSYRVFLFLIFPIIILILFIQELTKKYLHKNIIYNLIVITLICGITNTIIQLIYSNKVQDLQKRYIKTVYSIPKAILTPETDLKNIFFGEDNIYFSVLVPETYQLVFSKEYKQKKLITPTKTELAHRFFKTLDFNFKENLVYMFFTQINIKNKFWDLTQVGEIFDKKKNISDNYQKEYSFVDVIDIDIHTINEE